MRGVSRMESLGILLEKADRAFSPAERASLASAKNDRYRALLAGLSPADLSEDTKQALAALRAMGLKLAVGSSSRNARFILARLGLGSFLTRWRTAPRSPVPSQTRRYSFWPPESWSSPCELSGGRGCLRRHLRRRGGRLCRRGHQHRQRRRARGVPSGKSKRPRRPSRPWLNRIMNQTAGPGSFLQPGPAVSFRFFAHPLLLQGRGRKHFLPVSDLSRGYSRKRTHFEREGLKPLLVAIKH